MSAGPKHEIVIIRRGGHGDHDDHHGGVWKIAFADFMTAMMAFFLVMWLISANDKTRASVARYFNPVKLVDATTQPRGLHDPKKDDSGITASPNTKDEGKSKEMKKDPAGDKPDAAKETASGREKRLDAALRDNPMAALAEIAADHGVSDNGQLAQHASAPVIGRNGGAAFRDPFAPPPPSLVSDNSADEDATDAKPKASPVDAKNETASSRPSSEAKGTDTTVQELKPAPEKATELAAQLKSSMAAASHGGAEPTLDVRSTNDGYLISLTDTGSFSMFANGSAVPSRRTVLLMESVAKVLATRRGNVVVRGFTDNKQFRSGGRYDNWRLSLDRAQTAHYMLIRGGFADTRIVSVEGLADRAARPGADPGSPLNRRIEILLKDAAR